MTKRPSYSSLEDLRAATDAVGQTLDACADKLGGHGCDLCADQVECMSRYDLAISNRVGQIERYARWHEGRR